MKRYFSRSKHWLLLAIFAFLFLAASTASRAQSDEDDQDQFPVPEQYSPTNASYDSQARIVRLSYVDGQVRIDTGHGYESATMNVPVVERTWLQTRSDGWAEVQFEDGSVARLAPDTVIAFTRLGRLSSGATVTTVDLDQGEAEFKIANRDGGEFEVTVKNKTISLDHAASFRVTSTNQDPLEVAVWKGKVNVHDSESGGDVAVNKNETFALDPANPAQYALDKGADTDQLDQWSRDRDDALNAYASGGQNYPYQYGADDLNQYGQYFDDPGYGTLWQPNGVNIGWDPFGNGYWSYSPGFGYTWVSAYPWGWLPYRYGHWVYVNNRGWCWAPGGWTRWHTRPRWVNAPAGFHPPAPPSNKTIVVSGAPGRVVRAGPPTDHGGAPIRSGGTSGLAGRLGDRDGDDRGRSNRHVFTNDNVAREPKTDVPTAQPGKTVDVDSKPKVVDRQPPADAGTLRNPDAGRFRGDAQPMRNPDAGRFNSEGNSSRNSGTPGEDHSRGSYAPPPAHAVVPPSEPVRQYTPPPQPAPVHSAPAPVHQSAPAPPQRSFSPPPAESHGSESGHSGRPK